MRERRGLAVSTQRANATASLRRLSRTFCMADVISRGRQECLELMRVVRIVLLTLLLLGATAACDSPSGPDGERYELVAINGLSLPRAYPGFPALEVLSGEVVLRDNGTMRDVLVMRCAASLPPGTNCQVANNGRLEREGTYSRSAGWVRLSDTEYPTSFSDNSVVITFSSISMGGIPAVHEYRR
jgi:hypothetical protein